MSAHIPATRLRAASLAVAAALAAACGAENPTGGSAVYVTGSGAAVVTTTATEAAVDNQPPAAVFLTQPRADATGVVSGRAPLAVTFNMCQSTDVDAGDQLRYTYDFENNGLQDARGTCRATREYTEPSTARLCVSDRQDGHEICQIFKIEIVEDEPALVEPTPEPSPSPEAE